MQRIQTIPQPSLPQRERSLNDDGPRQPSSTHYRIRNSKVAPLGALALAVLAVGVDGTVLSVALPTLSKALHASESDLQWFSSGYFLVLAAAMLPAGLLGDRYGRKKVLLVSLALFGVGSAGCAYSRSVGEFMAARALVGLAGAGLIVMALSVLTVLFARKSVPRLWESCRLPPSWPSLSVPSSVVGC